MSPGGLRLLCLTFVALFFSDHYVSATPPSIILIVTDDHGYGDLGSFGSEDLRTPNLDALVNSGAKLTHWYANSSVCAPSRASFMSGKYPHNAGVPDLLAPRSPGVSLNLVTLAEALKTSGYRTGAVGKWHMGAADKYLPNQRGFDAFFGHLEGTLDYFSHMYYLPRAKRPFHDLWRNNKEVWEEGSYTTDLFTREAKAFIRNNYDQPFFLYVAFNAPHYPLHVPRAYLERFSHLDPHRQRIAATLAVVDEGVGKITNQLEELGIRDDTVIFFMGDNGGSNEPRNFMSGETDQFFTGSSNGGLKGFKGSLFEGGIRVPACISWPGVIEANTVINEMGVGMDLYPTFLKLAGVELSNHELDGFDVMPMIKDGAESPHDFVCWEYVGQFAIRRGKWKLVLNGKLDFWRKAPEVYLSDLDIDPYETNNLANKHPEVVEELKGKLNAWFESVSSN